MATTTTTTPTVGGDGEEIATSASASMWVVPFGKRRVSVRTRIGRIGKI